MLVVPGLNTNIYIDNINKSKLDTATSLNYAEILKGNILGKDKQEKVNLIVVLAKLLDCIVGGESISNDFSNIMDHTLFSTLFSIVSLNMSTETYKAILKISVILISGSIFKLKDDSIDKYLPLYESLIDYLDVIDIITQKLYLQDNKITYNTIKLVNDLIVKALKFQYNGIITLAGRLKHVTLFSTIGNLIETDDKLILDAIDNLKVSYYNLNDFLSKTKFDLSIKSHQVMLNNLFIFLEVSLNEYGTPAKSEEYVKAGFTDNPRKFVVDNFTILLAMDLKIFLKDPNMTFKKRFHEELMMSDHNRTFPLYLFMEQVTDLWLGVFHKADEYPNINNNILSWELMIFYSMNTCLILWQQTNAQLEDTPDVERIMQLIASNIDYIETNLGDANKSIEDCLDLTANETSESLRDTQIKRIKSKFASKWDNKFTDFNKSLAVEVMDFVAEQRVIQLLKGSWVYTESHGESLLKSNGKRATGGNKHYFLLLSPNRQLLYYKEFADKPIAKPSFEEMESQYIKLADIVDLKSIKIGEQVGEEDKNKNSRLISIKGTISYEKITLLGAGGKRLLNFNTDTQVNKYVWLDGLKMLKGMIKPGQLSADTEAQLESLIEIRRNTQLLNLEDLDSSVFVNEIQKTDSSEYNVDTDDGDEDDEDDDFYDINELSTVINDTYHYK